MMLRLLAFALHADYNLLFGDSIGTDDEPALWKKDFTGSVGALWIDVGLPDEKRIRKVGGRTGKVYIEDSGGRAADVWINGISETLERPPR